MNFMEMVQTLLQRPGYLAVLAERNTIFRLSNTGYLMNATKAKATYATINTTHILAVTWEVWTPAQLEDMARNPE